MIESLLIVGLAAVLAFLVWYRQVRTMEARRRENELQQGQQQQGQQEQPQAGDAAGAGLIQQDRGLFPNPGDPDFANWVAGGIGH